MLPARFWVNGMIKAIIFDFDGVLVESLDIKEIAFARLFEAEGETVVRSVVEFHRANGGVSRYDKFRYYYRELLKRELSEGRFQELCLQFYELVLEEVIKCPYVSGAREFLDTHARAMPCFVASATPEHELREIINRRDIVHYFKKVYGAPKSKADAVAEILADECLSAGEVLYVGDAIADYEAAIANGVHFVARCNQTNHVFDGVSCIKIKDLNMLCSVVNNMNRMGPACGPPKE